jgi:hypothetical protein
VDHPSAERSLALTTKKEPNVRAPVKLEYRVESIGPSGSSGTASTEAALGRSMSTSELEGAVEVVGAT